MATIEIDSATMKIVKKWKALRGMRENAETGTCMPVTKANATRNMTDEEVVTMLVGIGDSRLDATTNYAAKPAAKKVRKTKTTKPREGAKKAAKAKATKKPAKKAKALPKEGAKKAKALPKEGTAATNGSGAPALPENIPATA